MSKRAMQRLAILRQPPTLLDVLRPRFYQANPRRSKAITTVIQLDIDKSGHLDADSIFQDDKNSGSRSGHKRRKTLANSATGGDRP